MFKRSSKILGKICLLLVVLLFAFLIFERVRGQISLANYKRELSSRNETLAISKLTAPPVADAENGAPDLLRLMDSIKKGRVFTENPPPKMKLVAPGKAMTGYRENFWIEGKLTNTWAEVALNLATNKEILGQLKATTTKPAFDFKLDHSKGFDMVLHHLAPVKSLCQWLGPAFQNALRDGDNQAAHENLLASIALPRVMGNDRIVISELVRIAISTINVGSIWEALQSDVWTDEQLAEIQKEWEKNTFVTNMVTSLRVERADCVTCFARLEKSNDETYNYMFPNWRSVLTSAEEPDSEHWWQNEFFRKQIYCRVWRFAWLSQDETFYLKSMQQLIDHNGARSEKEQPRMEEYWFGLGKAPRSNFYDNWRFGMSMESIATLSMATVKAARAETDRSMVLCAIALKRYFLRYGKPATELSALVPEFLQSVPIDYMDGKPMKYRLNADGTWLLYSVGDNGVDDGGDPSTAKPEQSYRSIWRGRDVVWPLPASRDEIESWRKSGAKN